MDNYNFRHKDGTTITVPGQIADFLLIRHHDILAENKHDAQIRELVAKLKGALETGLARLEFHTQFGALTTEDINALCDMREALRRNI